MVLLLARDEEDPYAAGSDFILLLGSIGVTSFHPVGRLCWGQSGNVAPSINTIS
jgi:hypothetical protein